MRVSICLSVLIAMVGIAGCSSGGGDPVETAAPGPASAGNTGPGEARTLDIPRSSTAPAPPPGERRELSWTVPASWTEEPPSSSMRWAQYRVDGSAGPGSCVVFYFGPGQGGDPMANAQRWAGQFTQPDGSSSADAMKVSTLTDAHRPTQIVEVTGTYGGGMTMTDAPAPELPGYMLLGAIVQGPDAPWFFKFTGPEATVRGHRQGFLEMVGSIRDDG